MKPHKVSFYLYAESEQEVTHLQESLYALVSKAYAEGVLVTATKLNDALCTFGKNPIVTNYFKK